MCWEDYTRMRCPVQSYRLAGTERRASGAANGRSEARAEAIGGRLQAFVGHGIRPGLAVFPSDDRTAYDVRLVLPTPACRPLNRALGAGLALRRDRPLVHHDAMRHGPRLGLTCDA